KDHTSVDFAAAGSVSINKSISGGPNVRLLSAAAKITVAEGIADSATSVISWPPGALMPKISGGAKFNENGWSPLDTLSPGPPRGGYWWQNWPRTFGYVAPFRIVPRSVDDIATAVANAGAGHVMKPVKAVGGGWSFTDAALPFLTQAEVDQASIRLRGAWQR